MPGQVFIHWQIDVVYVNNGILPNHQEQYCAICEKVGGNRCQHVYQSKADLQYAFSHIWNLEEK